MPHTFHGAWPALLTPTATDGGVDLAALRRLTDHLVGKGIDGLYLCGSTGEGVLQNVQERKSVTATVMEQVGQQLPVIVHVGCNATRDAVTLAQHAQAAGAAGISSILPVYGGGLDGTFFHYEAIAGAVPDLPFFPYLFGGQLDAVSLMKELLARIPNVAGAKYTGPNMYEMWRIINLRQDDWTIFSGMDEQCVYGAMSGAPGNIGSTLNFMPGIYGKIRECYLAGEVQEAVALQHKANRVTETLIAFGFAGALREGMRMLGVDCGEPRGPHLGMPSEKRDSFHAALKKAGAEEVLAM